MTKDIGGPAFPCHPGIENPIYDGMTLRDYFAAKAMQALVSDSNWRRNHDFESSAERSYGMADAMLKARAA